jgi:CO dehydrogenase maturation factor
MEAGIEHLSRGTSRAVNKLIVVVEPGRRSIETALRIKDLAEDIGVNNIAVVGNKIRSNSERSFIIDNLPDFQFLGFMPFDQAIVDADLANHSVLAASHLVVNEVTKIFQVLLADKESVTD